MIGSVITTYTRLGTGAPDLEFLLVDTSNASGTITFNQKRIDVNSDNLYSLRVSVGEVVRIIFIHANLDAHGDLSVFRKDFTTDDQNGNRGIIDTPITPVLDLYIPNSVTIYKFTGSTIPSAYDFQYYLDAQTLPGPIPPDPCVWNRNNLRWSGDTNNWATCTTGTPVNPMYTKYGCTGNTVADTCNCANQGTTVYYTGATYDIGTILYADPIITTNIGTRYWNDGINTYYVLNGVITSSNVCPTPTPTPTPTLTPTPSPTLTPTPTPTPTQPPGTRLWSVTSPTGATTNQVIYGSDGFIYVSNTASGLNNVNSTIRKYNSNGAQSTSFNPRQSLSVNYGFRGLAMQSGKIIASLDGYYDFGTPQYALLRFNSNGAVDTTFSSPFTSSTVIPDDIEVLSDNTIAFSQGGALWKTGVNGGPRSGGTINATYLNKANDGKLLVAGATGCYKLNNDLTIDTTYTFSGSTSMAGGIQLANGDLIWWNQCSLIKTNSSGVRDTGFTVNVLSDNCGIGITRPKAQGNKIILIGRFFSINGREIGSIIRLNSDGSNDTTWDVPIRANNGFYGSSWFQSRTVSDCVVVGDALYTTGDYFNYNSLNSTLLTKIQI